VQSASLYARQQPAGSTAAAAALPKPQQQQQRSSQLQAPLPPPAAPPHAATESSERTVSPAAATAASLTQQHMTLPDVTQPVPVSAGPDAALATGTGRCALAAGAQSPADAATTMQNSRVRERLTLGSDTSSDPAAQPEAASRSDRLRAVKALQRRAATVPGVRPRNEAPYQHCANSVLAALDSTSLGGTRTAGLHAGHEQQNACT
jgi:hypothetical protein